MPTIFCIKEKKFQQRICTKVIIVVYLKIMEDDFFSFFFCLNFLINFIRVLCLPPPNPHPLPQAITTVLSVSMRVFVVLLNACTVFTQPPTLLPCDRCQPVLCTYAYVCILFVKLLCSLVLGVVFNITRENQPRNWYLTMRDGLREI